MLDKYVPRTVCWLLKNAERKKARQYDKRYSVLSLAYIFSLFSLIFALRLLCSIIQLHERSRSYTEFLHLCKVNYKNCVRQPK